MKFVILTCLFLGACATEIPEVESTEEPLTLCSETDNLSRLEQVAHDYYVARFHTEPNSCGGLITYRDEYEYHCTGFLSDIRVDIPTDRILYGQPGQPLDRMEKAVGFATFYDYSRGVWNGLTNYYCNCSGCFVMFSNASICYHPGWDNGPLTGYPDGGACATVPCQ